MIPPKRFDILPPGWGMLRRSRRVLIFLQILFIRRVNEGSLKKNQNAPRPSEHPPVREEKMSKRLVGGIKVLVPEVVF